MFQIRVVTVFSIGTSLIYFLTLQKQYGSLCCPVCCPEPQLTHCGGGYVRGWSPWYLIGTWWLWSRHWCTNLHGRYPTVGYIYVVGYYYVRGWYCTSQAHRVCGEGTGVPTWYLLLPSSLIGTLL